MSVALDTMALIWGIQKGGNPKQANLREMQYRAHILFDMLDEQKERICIPCDSVGELLVGVPAEKHDDFIAYLQKSFFCPSYGPRESALAAKLFQEHKKLPPNEQTGRVTLSSDVKIVATAKIAGARDFYSNDKKCRKLATLAGMTARDLPTKHPDMYRDAEFKKRFGQPTD